VITSAVLAAGSLTSPATSAAPPAQGPRFAETARVDFYQSDNDASGHGEGRAYVGMLTADASGNFTGTVAAPSLVVGDRVTATATDATNSTSEFGTNLVVQPLVTSSARSRSPARRSRRGR